LTKLLADNAPGAMKEQKFESYFGRKIAIDASMSIYQFLVSVVVWKISFDRELWMHELLATSILCHLNYVNSWYFFFPICYNLCMVCLCR
jgi:hypothetical protein